LPRTAMACLVGIALSISGLVYQSTFQNELQVGLLSALRNTFCFH
jgi:ABC-type Fe3+-siderophore transport system permease subunit